MIVLFGASTANIVILIDYLVIVACFTHLHFQFFFLKRIFFHDKLVENSSLVLKYTRKRMQNRFRFKKNYLKNHLKIFYKITQNKSIYLQIKYIFENDKMRF